MHIRLFNFFSSWFTSMCGAGLVLGTLFVAASLTPSLVPRAPLLQGVLSGLCFAAGYGSGVLLRGLWRSLGWPEARGRFRQISLGTVLLLCLLAMAGSLWWAAAWQNRLRALMDLPAIDSVGPIAIALVASGVFALLLLVARGFRHMRQALTGRFQRRLPAPTAAVLAVVATVLLFWTLGDGLLVRAALHMLDSTYSELDARMEEERPRPTDVLKSGGPGSLLKWSTLGRQGRRMVAGEPDQAQIEAVTGRAAKEPLRVYVGLASADTPQARAQLALAELQRIGAFERDVMVIATPTGTGWVDEKSQQALEYLLLGDVATVSVQYSYFASWLALLTNPDYGMETARAVFAVIYEYWQALPRDARPRLYLHGLSLGALNSDLSHDLHQIIGDPYHGALWAGPTFNTPTWRNITDMRNEGSPAWLPRVRDGSVVRFTAQRNHLEENHADWGPYRVVFLQYASDAITFFDPQALWKKPVWMTPPLGPDVSPDMVWIPVVTFLQLSFDVMVAGMPPTGYGHTYAFDHYLDAWAELIGPSDWDAPRLAALKETVAKMRSGAAAP
jgi:uncharacterized membrane protein